VTATNIENAECLGSPCAVKHADKVCTHESVNALGANARMSAISVVNSSPC
jgi:hypothetical protein